MLSVRFQLMHGLQDHMRLLFQSNSSIWIGWKACDQWKEGSLLHQKGRKEKEEREVSERGSIFSGHDLFPRISHSLTLGSDCVCELDIQNRLQNDVPNV